MTIHYPALDQLNSIVNDIGDWELTLRFEHFRKRLVMVQEAHPGKATSERKRCQCEKPELTPGLPTLCNKCYGSLRA